MARCGYRRDKDGFRYYVPQCWGGLYDKSGCYCEPYITSRFEELERRVRELEKQLSARPSTTSPAPKEAP